MPISNTWFQNRRILFFTSCENFAIQEQLFYNDEFSDFQSGKITSNDT